MGWLFMPRIRSRKALIEHLRRSERFGETNELLRSSAVGNNHWYLARHRESGEVWIGLDLMQGGLRTKPDHGWGYKDISASMGPCEVNCPVSYLDLAGPPRGDYEAEWREKVRAYHRNAKVKAQAKAGDRVRYGGHEYRLERPAGPRKGWVVTRMPSGSQWRLNARQLAQAEAVSSQVAA